MFLISPIDRTHGVTLATGFQTASTWCGLRSNQADDLAIVVADQPSTCAVVSTANKVKAAPVQLNLDHLAQSNHTAKAVVINAANANACTGFPGLQVAKDTAGALANLVDAPDYEVLVASTGVIGVPLPVTKILDALPDCYATIKRGPRADLEAAQAIMTTDTKPKMASIRLQDHGDDPIFIGGMAKGSGMIAPAMATTITVITTDAKLPQDQLQKALEVATAQSFNKISVDGSMSTNDTIILLASGLAGPVDPIPFTEALTQVCTDLAAQVIADGEGATQVIAVRVSGAQNDVAADQAARFIGGDLLVRTAFTGRDPNWGRVVAAAGASGVELDPDGLTVVFAGTKVCEQSLPVPFDKAALSAAMDAPEVDVLIDLGVGDGQGYVLVTDLTKEYISINADYTT